MADGPNVNLAAGGSGGSGFNWKYAAVAAAAIAAAPTTAAHVRSRRPSRATATAPDGVGSSSASSRQASPMWRSRCRGSFSRQLAMSRRTRRGTRSHAGVSLITAASVSPTSSPPKGRAPVSISYRTQPNAQMSARLSTGWPRACSGLMYAAVPRIIPGSVIAGDVIVGEIEAPGDTASPAPSPSRARSPVPSPCRRRAP